MTFTKTPVAIMLLTLIAVVSIDIGRNWSQGGTANAGQGVEYRLFNIKVGTSTFDNPQKDMTDGMARLNDLGRAGWRVKGFHHEVGTNRIDDTFVLER